MIVLNQYENRIKSFIETSIKRFNEAHGQFSAIGIYCCPWSGWISTNFNLHKSIEESYTNCPDFEFVEFDLLDLDEWREEYEDESTFKITETGEAFKCDDGDEILNEIVFKFLEPIAIDVHNKTTSKVLLQMLDSNFSKII
jgi:hypothetical protein